jgi:hypothetical protein
MLPAMLDYYCKCAHTLVSHNTADLKLSVQTTNLSYEDQLLPPVAYGVIAAEVSTDLLPGRLVLRPLLLQGWTRTF